ncbi:muconolactone delta-isomerase [Streptacidiphilus sp. MAP12-16]
MKEFLVELTTTVPEGTDPTDVARRGAAEAVRAGELAAAGHLVRLWRPVGEPRSIGLWRAADEAQLYEKVLGTLPLWPWMTPVVTAVQSHPNDPGRTSDAVSLAHTAPAATKAERRGAVCAAGARAPAGGLRLRCARAGGRARIAGSLRPGAGPGHVGAAVGRVVCHAFAREWATVVSGRARFEVRVAVGADLLLAGGTCEHPGEGFR